MPKVWCAENECVFNKDNECVAEEINLSAGHVHTKHQGFAHKLECRTFQQSDEAKEMFEMLKSFFDKNGV